MKANREGKREGEGRRASARAKARREGKEGRREGEGREGKREGEGRREGEGKMTGREGKREGEGEGEGRAPRCVRDWGQCGGKGYRGPRNCCNRKFECKRKNRFFSQCRPKRESACRYREFITGRDLNCDSAASARAREGRREGKRT